MNLSLAPQLPLSFQPAALSLTLPQPDLLEPGWSQIRNADEALRFLNRAADRDPRQFPVGITFSSYEMGSRELSCWFESWAQVWTALRYVAIHLSGKQGDEQKALVRSLSQLRLSYGSDDLLVARLQRLFGPQLRILRMGTFQDLCAGAGSYARALVLGYLGFEPTALGREVPRAELERFIGFLRKRAFH